MGVLLSVVIPCYQEEDNVAHAWQAVRDATSGLGVDVEVLFVDDGSTDRTLLRLRELAAVHAEVRYLSFSRNFGKESAMLAGLAHARGQAVVIMDGDLQHPPELIGQLLERHREGYDQVVARRTRTGDGRSRTVQARLYYAVVNRLVDVRLDDGMGDFRLLSRSAVDALLTMREYNRFSKGLFAWIGFPTAVVDYPNHLRREGQSSWSFRRLLDYGIDGVLSFNNKPLRLAVYLGGVITLLSAAYVLWLVVRTTVYGIESPGYVTLITAVLLLGGLQLTFLGIVGEYIGRIYFETKQRPHYLLKETDASPEVPSPAPTSADVSAV
ncbi:MAG: putative glycosyl transferase family 2 [Frankiales bacterium]|nr:putative glycosyl transferase family 2 [Frankiales bacterium]